MKVDVNKKYQTTKENLEIEIDDNLMQIGHNLKIQCEQSWKKMKEELQKDYEEHKRVYDKKYVEMQSKMSSSIAIMILLATLINSISSLDVLKNDIENLEHEIQDLR